MTSRSKVICFVFGILVFLLYFKILPFGLSLVIGYFKNSNNLVKNLILVIAEIIIFLVLFMIFRKKIVE